MKNLLKKLVLKSLQRSARRRMRKFKGKVICVTGSIGKTSMKEAIYVVLNSKFRVTRNPGNMNTDFGLPLAILGMESGYSSAIKWSYLVVKGYLKSFKKMYSEMLVVETGVDKPGDMDVLMSIVKPDVAVMNMVAPVHLEDGQFENLDEIFEEKAKLVKALPEDGYAILNIDDDRVKRLAAGRPKSKTVTFGVSPDADFKATGITESLEGIKFNLGAENHRVEVTLSILGKHNAVTILPAIICGVIMGMTIEEGIEALKRFKLPPGRMNLIEGAIDGVSIIDSSYNSSPKACIEALKTLAELKPANGGRRIAVLGTMNELGADSEKLHHEVGVGIPDCCDMLVTVGKGAEAFAEAAAEKGFKNIFKYFAVQEAIDDLKDKIKENDIILVKGSQNNVRLEKFVKAFMKFPDQAGELLARQGKSWQKI